MFDSKQMSDAGRSMLIELEGSRSLAYRDVAGHLTIGVGHMLTRDELSSGKIVIDGERVRWRRELTEQQIGLLLAHDLFQFERAVCENVIPMLSQSQFDALVSFAFNVGAGAFRNSTLLRRLNGGRHSDVPQEFRRWIYAGGETRDGLVARREVEIERWNEREAMA